jgi:site-specific DNA-methyltransferase (adenine-specific)
MIEITNEDNMLLMSRFPDNYFELAIVDPPYGINIAKWDTIDLKPSKKYFEELFRVSKNQIIWGGNYFNLPPSEAWICWDKTMKSGKMALGKGFKSEFELAWTNTENKATMLHLTHDGNIQGFNGGSVNYNYKSIHPTQKPVKLYKWILDKYAKEGDKILDTHLGSGSIAIACHDYGFNLTACELDKEYFDKAMERLKLHQSQTKLF